MSTNERILKLKSIFEKEPEFVRELAKLTDANVVAQKINDKDKSIEVTADDVVLVGKLINEMIEKKTDNLSDADLESIAGGENEVAPTPGGFVEGLKRGLTGGLLRSTKTIQNKGFKDSNKNDIAAMQGTNLEVDEGLGISGKVGTGVGLVALAGAGYGAIRGLEYGMKKLGWIKPKN